MEIRFSAYRTDFTVTKETRDRRLADKRPDHPDIVVGFSIKSSPPPLTAEKEHPPRRMRSEGREMFLEEHAMLDKLFVVFAAKDDAQRSARSNDSTLVRARKK